MTAADAIGSAGVFLLLLAFALNLVGRLAHESRAYQALNTVGAGLAAFASYRIGFWPFVVLEVTWMCGAAARGSPHRLGPAAAQGSISTFPARLAFRAVAKASR